MKSRMDRLVAEVQRLRGDGFTLEDRIRMVYGLALRSVRSVPAESRAEVLALTLAITLDDLAAKET